MSLFVPSFDESVVVREADAEVVGRAPTTVRLLADSSATGGALSTQRVTLTAGADGAKPHLHENRAEMFFLLDGAADILSGEDVLTAGPVTWSWSRRASRTPSPPCRAPTPTC